MGDSKQPNYCKDVDAQKIILVSAIISNKLAEKLTVDEQGVIGNLFEAVGQNLLVIQAVNQMLQDCAQKNAQKSQNTDKKDNNNDENNNNNNSSS